MHRGPGVSIDSVEVELASITAAVSILGNECESGMATEAGQATWTGIKVILGWTNNPLVAEIPQRAASIITTSPDIKDKILELLKAGKTGTATDIAWTIKTVRDSRMLFAPLNHESYQRRCESIVPSIYLTLISIIEGVALGLLAQQLLTFSPHDGKDHVEQLSRPYSVCWNHFCFSDNCNL